MSNAMKATLLCRDAARLESLRHMVQAEGHEVVRAGVRDPGKPLAPLLRAMEGDLLVVEGGCGAAEDLAAIDHLTFERPGTVVLLLCETREPEALIAAMRSGVHEVLHSPPDAAEIAGALRRAARRQGQAHVAAKRARIIAFVACKGGSGATLLATNFAYTLAAERQKSVAMIDLDLEYGDAAAFLTDQHAKASVADVARQVERLDAKLLAASMLAVAPRLSLLPAAEDPESGLAVTGQQVERILEVAAETFDVVVLDVGRMLDGGAVKALDKADVICLVMEDLVPFIRDARRLLRSLRALGYTEGKLHLVVNRYDKRRSIPIAEIEKAVGAKVKQTVPNSFETVAQAINLGLPLVKIDARDPVVEAVRELASDLVEPLPERAGWLGRLVAQH